MAENEFDIKKLWLPYPEIYDLPERAEQELRNFLNAPILRLSKDYREPDPTTYYFWAKLSKCLSTSMVYGWNLVFLRAYQLI